MLKIFTYSIITPVDLIQFVYEGAFSYARIYDMTIDAAIEKKYSDLNHLMCWYYCNENYLERKTFTLKSLLLK